MNRNFWTILSVIVIVACAVTLILVVKTKGAQCLADPLVYGAKEATKANAGNELMCSCGLRGVFPSPTVEFNSTGQKITPGHVGGNYDDGLQGINVSELFKQP